MTEQLVEALKTLGLKSKEAIVLSFLMKNYDNPVSQWDIERAVELRQPYVSSALRTIEQYNWVDVSMKLKHPGVMGRPENIYKLVVTPSEIAQDLHETYIAKSPQLRKSMRTIQKCV
jgi:predicted transcriptional regulator